MTFYEIIYMLVTVVTMYTISKYMHFFMPERRVKAWVEFLMYAGYYAVLVCTYLLLEIPIVMMVLNLSMQMIVSLACRANLKTRIWSVLIIYVIMMCVEIIFVLIINGMSGFSVLKEFRFTDSFCQIVIGVMSFVTAEVLTRLKKKKQGVRVPLNYWCCVVLLPLTSLYIILVLFMSGIDSETVVVTVVAMLLAVNILIFQLYDALGEILMKNLERKYLEQQCDIMQISLNEMKKLRHDLKNHMFSLQHMIKNGEANEALKYIEQITEAESNIIKYIVTGNTAFDSILNYKLWEARQQGIKTEVSVTMSTVPDISSYDASVILGNLFDNAITAAVVSEQKRIEFKMRYEDSRLIICISNSFSGEIKKVDDENYETTKKDKKEHGFGIKNIRSVLEKHNGEMEISTEKGLFEVSIIMFL